MLLKTLYMERENCMATLSDLRKDVNTEESTIQFFERRVQAANLVLSWVEQEWDVKSVVKERLHDILSKGYSVVAKEVGTSEAAQRAYVSMYMRQLKEKLGASILMQVREGNVKDISLQLAKLRGKATLSSIVLKEVSEGIKQADKPCLDLLECLDEVKFLRVYSRLMLDQKFQSLDEKRLGGLACLLCSNDLGCLAERNLLLRFLLGGITFKEFQEQAKLLTEL